MPTPTRREPPGASPPELQRVLAELDLLVNWERRARRAPARFGLESIRDLLDRLGRPERGLPVVHVAGTKGKGSVAALVARGLQGAGLRVGRYASPHVEHVTERVEIDGRPIDPPDLARALRDALDARAAATRAETPGSDATWFDVVTAAALVAFRGAGCDWIVAECGLGGRLDSTNALTGEVAVVTNIDLEHTEVLGATRAAIAAEKAGILKPGGALVTGIPARRRGRPDEARRVVLERARELGVRVVPGPAELECAEDWAALPIAERNRDLAGRVLDELGRLGWRGRAGEPLSGALLTPERVAAAALPGRMERRRAGGRPVVLDGAHVPESISQVLRDLSRGGLVGPAVVVLALGRDKDLEGVLKALGGRADRLICTTVGTDLFHRPDEIAARAEQLGLVAETAPDPRSALERATDLAKKDEAWVLVTGSLYLAGAVRPWTAPETRAC